MLDNHLVSQDLKTTSLVIADRFNKRHTEVLRSIRNLDLPEDFSQRNFASAEFMDAQGKPRPMFEVTKDGFTLLVMGFTGKEAMQWKIKFIEAFNIMEQSLTQTLTSAQKRAIQEAVQSRARCATNKRQAIIRQYEKLKTVFKVAQYKDIPQAKFERALEFIETSRDLPAPHHLAQIVPVNDLLLTAQGNLEREDKSSQALGRACLDRAIQEDKRGRNLLERIGLVFIEASKGA